MNKQIVMMGILGLALVLATTAVYTQSAQAMSSLWMLGGGSHSVPCCGTDNCCAGTGGVRGNGINSGSTMTQSQLQSGLDPQSTTPAGQAPVVVSNHNQDLQGNLH